MEMTRMLTLMFMTSLTALTALTLGQQARHPFSHLTFAHGTAVGRMSGERGVGVGAGNSYRVRMHRILGLIIVVVMAVRAVFVAMGLVRSCYRGWSCAAAVVCFPIVTSDAWSTVGGSTVASRIGGRYCRAVRS